MKDLFKFQDEAVVLRDGKELKIVKLKDKSSSSQVALKNLRQLDQISRLKSDIESNRVKITEFKCRFFKLLENVNIGL